MRVERVQVSKWRQVRQKLGLSLCGRGPRHLEAAAAAQSITTAELRGFISLCEQRYDTKRIDPGAAGHPLTCLPPR
jgi:hypothetical protein